jgi:hypothetical protein
MKITTALILLAMLAPCARPAGLARLAARRAAAGQSARFLRQDRAMHRATPASPLPRAQSARRYTSWARAQRESKTGLPPNAHMAPGRPAAARPPSPSTLKRRYGLRRTPTAVETLRVPKGQPVRKGRVSAERRNRWEWSSPRRVPAGGVTVRRLNRPWRKP